MRPPSVPVLLLLAAATAAFAPSAHAEPRLPEGRVVLAPLNLGVRAAPELAGAEEPVWTELVGLFETRNPPPASLARDGAEALFAEAMATGDHDGRSRDVYAAYGRFARRLAEQVEFGALVIPSLVVRAAEIEGFRAAWDGVERVIETPLPDASFAGAPSGLVKGQSRGGRGAMRAASLHVAVLSPEGALRFEGVGGLALLQRLERRERPDGGGEIALVDRSAPFADAEALREGVRAAFEQPLPASASR